MAELHDDCYAYSAMHKYPIHTKQAALQSYKQYVKEMDQIPQERCALINEAFVKAAAFHGIKYPDLFTPQEPVRQSYSFDLQDGTHVQISKVASDNDIHNTVTYIKEHRSQMPYEAVKKIALYACKQGQAMDSASQDICTLQKYAGLGVGEKEEMLNEFLKRATLINLPQSTKHGFYALYHAMDADSDFGIMKKAAEMASLLDSIDDLYNLRSEYGKYIKAPQDACFKETVDDLVKQASDFLHVPSTDTVLSKTALLERKPEIQQFLADKYNFKAQNDEQLLNKVASMDAIAISALVEKLDD